MGLLYTRHSFLSHMSQLLLCTYWRTYVYVRKALLWGCEESALEVQDEPYRLQAAAPTACFQRALSFNTSKGYYRVPIVFGRFRPPFKQRSQGRWGARVAGMR